MSWNAPDSDDELQNEAEIRFSGKTALLVAIDFSPAMFESWEENKETPFVAAINCCEAMWRSKVISSPTELVSIVLVGTEKAKNSPDFPNLYQLQELATVKVDMIKQLIDMKLSLDYDGIGSSENYNLKDLFWLAKFIFDEKKTQTYNKKILYFTCEDNPHAGKPNLQEDVINKFKDLGKVDFNVITFKKDFEFQKFYSKVVEDESSVIYANDLAALKKVIHMKQKLKRSVCRSTMQIAPGIEIAVGYYSFVRQALPFKSIPINKRNNERVEKNVNVFRSNLGVPVLKSEERKVVQVQGEQAVFTPQQVKDLKYVHETGIKLIGFLRKQNFDNFTWFRSPGYFLYPDEERISGSKDLFTALLNRCSKLEKLPLIRMVVSRGKTPKLACLIPSIPDEDSKSVFPQGFHLFPIPFCDEIRKYEMEPNLEATPELISLMEKVVKKLTNKSFDVLDIKNPSLHSKWKSLEEEALEERFDDTEEFCDYTAPNEILMRPRLADLPSQIDTEAGIAAGSFGSLQSTAPLKKTVDMAIEMKNERLEKLTCEVLRGFLDSKSIPMPLRCRKAELVVLVKNHFEKQ